MKPIDPDVCYRALASRDARFDGRFFVGVTSTWIYCRPICPARTARRENCRFFPTAAAAQEEGFRPCLRCRPEIAPALGSWRGTSSTVSRGLALIANGELDGSQASVETLADRLGVGARQVRRLFQQHLGASPIAIAQARRVLFAKQLLHDTRLPMTEIALAAGFGSLRRFNETFQQLYARPPSAIRRRRIIALPEGTVGATGVTVRLRYRPPYDWETMRLHLQARAVEGIECVDEVSYRRTIEHEGQRGTVQVAHLPERHSLIATIRFPDVRSLSQIVERLRAMFDLDADVASISAHLAHDRRLAPLIAQRPGLRVPGCWDGFELAMRAVLGQQVSVEAARRLLTRFAQLCGMPLRHSTDAALVCMFPTAAEVARADLSALGMPSARRNTLTAVARAALADLQLFVSLDTVEATVARLRAIRGIGDWTAHYIALRAAREPDAFPATDLGLLRGAAVRGVRPSPAALSRRAERWRPWRAYGAQHLWAKGAA